jgi:hypothetical protein
MGRKAHRKIRWLFSSARLSKGVRGLCQLLKPFGGEDLSAWQIFGIYPTSIKVLGGLGFGSTGH